MNAHRARWLGFALVAISGAFGAPASSEDQETPAARGTAGEAAPSPGGRHPGPAPRRSGAPDENMAATAAAPEETKAHGWRLLLLPYAWLPTNDMTIGTDTYLQSEFTSIGDALNQVDYGGLLFLEFHRSKWAIYSDGMYVRLTSKSYESGLRTHSDIRQAMIEVASVRRFQGQRHGIEFLAGLRYFHLKSEVDVQIAGQFHDTFHWVEPIAGIRHRMRLSRRWHYDWRADFGGFGVGSEFTWQLVANLHYDISDRYSINLGYRHLDIDYENGDRIYESTLSGPMIGLSIKF